MFVLCILLLASTAPSLAGGVPFWTIQRDANHISWFVSPSGKSEFMTSVTTVVPYITAASPLDRGYLSKHWDAGFSPTGDFDAWAKAQVADVRAAGFKAIGCWSHRSLHACDIPISECLGAWTWSFGKRGQKYLWYTDGWQQLLEDNIRRETTPYANDSNLVGYYLDNELDWSPATVGADLYFLAGRNSPQRHEVMKVMAELWPDMESFNRAWGTHVRGMEDVAEWQSLPDREPPTFESHWLSHLAHDYFQTTTRLVRQYDHNHLILGIKFRSRAEQIPPEVVEASAAYVDANSFDIYPDEQARLPSKTLARLRLAHKPIIIAEFCFYSLNNRSGDIERLASYPNPVPDQKARAEACSTFVRRLAAEPDVIGADWFQWSDDPPSGTHGSFEPVNFGVVDLWDKPYEDLVAAIRQTSAAVNDWHRHSR